MGVLIGQLLIGNLTRAVDDILQFVADELIREFTEQGHKLTGALEDSIKLEIIQLSDGVIGTIYINDYYKFVDKGVVASRIPFNPGSGKKRSKYIDALIRYFRLRLNLSEEEAKGAAFATAHKHKREGMPTAASGAFSRNGRRTGFFTETIHKLQGRINAGIEDVFAGAMSNVLHELNSQLIGEVTIEL